MACALLVSMPSSEAQEGANPALRIEPVGTKLAENAGFFITVPDMLAVLDDIPAADRALMLSRPDQLERLIENLLLPRTIAADAIAAGDHDDPIVQAEIYQAAVEIIAKHRIANIREAAELDDYTAIARENYQRNPESYRIPEQFSFTLLMISDEPRCGQSPADAVGAIRERLGNGEEFDALVRHCSDYPDSRPVNGKFKDVNASDMLPEFREALRDLETGQISDTIEHESGRYIMRLDSHRASRLPEFSEIRDRLREEARKKHLDQVEDRYLENFLQENTTLLEAPFAEVKQRAVAE